MKAIYEPKGKYAFDDCYVDIGKSTNTKFSLPVGVKEEIKEIKAQYIESIDETTRLTIKEVDKL